MVLREESVDDKPQHCPTECAVHVHLMAINSCRWQILCRMVSFIKRMIPYSTCSSNSISEETLYATGFTTL